jgi:hypothetical protein
MRVLRWLIRFAPWWLSVLSLLLLLPTAFSGVGAAAPRFVPESMLLVPVPVESIAEKTTIDMDMAKNKFVSRAFLRSDLTDKVTLSDELTDRFVVEALQPGVPVPLTSIDHYLDIPVPKLTMNAGDVVTDGSAMIESRRFAASQVNASTTLLNAHQLDRKLVLAPLVHDEQIPLASLSDYVDLPVLTSGIAEGTPIPSANVTVIPVPVAHLTLGPDNYYFDPAQLRETPAPANLLPNQPIPRPTSTPQPR